MNSAYVGRTVLALASAWLVTGCAAPFSELQTARLAGPGRVEVTGTYSSVSATDEGKTEKIQDQYGVQVATGISDKADLRLRYERITDPDAPDWVVNAVGVGPKLALAPDHVAIYLPVGCAFGEDIEVSETWEFHPALLLTGEVGPYVDVTGSFKSLIGLTGEDRNLRFAANLGMGFGPDLDRWAIRPEVGVMSGSGGGVVRHVSVGLVVAAGSRPERAG
jgi:hypothetical protein